MKKIEFIIITLLISVVGYAQRPTVSEAMKNLSFTVEKPSSIKTIDGSSIPGLQFNHPESIFKAPRISRETSEYQVMTTNYDLQSNSALGNRIATWADGTASVVTSWDHSWNTSFPNRGTGYNYYNGYNFGNQPSSRIESEKSGWPSIAAIGNGEILASHTSSGTNIYKRSSKGQGSWSLIKTFSGYQWPRIAVSGSNDQYVHVVMATQESVGGVNINKIWYARSTNGGQSWTGPTELPLVNNATNGDYRNQLGADDYVMATNGNNVAIMLGAYTTEVFYIISHDNGATWSKQVIAPFAVAGVHAIDFADYPNGLIDTLHTSDNSHSIAIDDNGVVHATFGLFRWYPTDASHYSFWSAYGYGIVYWNSNYTNQQGGHEIPRYGYWSGDSNHPEWAANGMANTLWIDRLYALAEANGNQNLHVFGYVDEDGSGDIYYENVTGQSWNYRTKGLATMPGISVDNLGNIAIIYSVWSETRICNATDFSYRSAYVTYRNQYGQWSDDAINLSSDWEHQYDEVYSVFAAPKGYNGSFWMGYFADENQGLYLDIDDNHPNSNMGVLTDNYCYIVKVSPWGQMTTYTITATANPTNGGTVSGGGTYAQGSTCTLHATANSGYSFVKWTKNGTQVSTNPNYPITVTGNATYVAHFQQSTTYYNITATASPSNAGTITGAGSYASGSTCTLRAIPNSGYTFVNWLENGTVASTNATYPFAVTGNRSLIAVFDVATTYYDITATANPSSGGTVTGGGTYAQGSTCTLRATANSGYSFVNWTKNGTAVSTNSNHSFTVTGNASYVANFEPEPEEYTITVNAEPANGGTVSGGGTYAEGSTCVISAMPNEGYVFENWTRNGTVVSVEPTYSIVVNRNLTFVAHFAQNANQATITATAEPVEGGSVSGGGTYELGSNCTLNAVAAVGYEFVNWTLNGSQVSTDASFSFTITGNAVYVAHFSKIVNHYTVSANVQPANAGSVIGAGTYEEGTSCTLIAIANPTYTFVSWTENGAVVSTDEQYTFTVERDRNLVAVFSQGLFYTITASAGGNGSITPEGEVMVNPGEDKTFAIIPNSGCRVSKVLVDGVDVGPVESYTFRSVNANHSIRAQFSGLGVDEAFDLGLNLYPNPANDFIDVEGAEMKEIVIYDLLGIQRGHKDVNDNHVRIDTSSLDSGTYILKVTCQDGKIGHLRFVVAR